VLPGPQAGDLTSIKKVAGSLAARLIEVKALSRSGAYDCVPWTAPSTPNSIPG
jgi:hypothetical protein